MIKRVLVWLLIAFIGFSATAQTATQTDWTGGPGMPGPVNNWDNTFDMEFGVNWYSSPGSIELDFSPPMEHVVTASYIYVNHAYPVDIDGDNDMDILGAAGRYSPPYFFSGRIDWWENTTGSGTDWLHHMVDDSFTSAPSICSADLDGDGDNDVVGGARGNVNDLAWWDNADSVGNTWTRLDIPSSVQDATSVFAADINDDGNTDILASDGSSNKIVWLNNVDGSGMNWTEYTIDNSFNNAVDVFSADINGDGDMDALGAAFNGDKISWWENVDGSGTSWNEHVVDNDFNGARSVFAADVDGDGDNDILGAASLAWSVTWWENTDGSGTAWIEHTISNNFNYAYAVYASDMDDDGDSDVLGASFFGDDIVWWENTNGSGLDWFEHVVDGNFDGAKDVATADMDGDNDPDVIGAAQEDADISWWDVTCCTGSGELVSSIYDTEMMASWDSISWISEEPQGTSLVFQVRSSTDPEYMGQWSEEILMPGSLAEYLNDGDQYIQYKARLESNDPAYSPLLKDLSISWSEYLGIGNEYMQDKKHIAKLHPNYPNPFTDVTKIVFTLSHESHVQLSIYDIHGNIVERPVNNEISAGSHEVLWNSQINSPGIYYYRLETEGYDETRKMISLK